MFEAGVTKRMQRCNIRKIVARHFEEEDCFARRLERFLLVLLVNPNL